MGLATAYHLEQEKDAPLHVSYCCTDREYGRVRSVAHIKKSYLATLLAAPGDITLWQTGIDSNLIVIIPFTSGTYDPGRPLRLKGYGTRLDTYGPRDSVLTYSDPEYVGNAAYYQSIHQRSDIVLAFRTSSLIHICDTPAGITAIDPVEEDLEGEVVWNVECRMRSMNLPVKINAAPLAALFYCNPKQGNGNREFSNEFSSEFN